MENKAWWKQAVIYQVYPRSYMDSNGDGYGDLKGITSRLDYLAELGIDAIWLSPVFRSPQDDNGYDISDYQDIDPLFGSLEDMDELIAEAKKRNIRIIMDMVLNHSSDEHPWFLEAKKSRDNPYHDFYVWRDGVPGTPPNDMRASFGGSAWQWVEECRQYYLHLFSVKQPDLNWHNPKVREEIYKMVNWWVDRGVGGFRMDVIDLFAKEPDQRITTEGPMLHTYIKELSRAAFQGHDLVTVGEAWSANTENALLYSNPDGSELSMVFQFEHIVLDQQEGKEKWDLAPFPFVKFKKTLGKWQKALYEKGWNSLFLDNHDLPRAVSQFGNDDPKFREVSAKMLATMIHGMQGTPYVYQGEELGMTNASYEISEYQDIELLNAYKERREKGYSEEEIMKSIHAKGRDNARTPMQWTDGPNAGFTTGKPWMKVNPNYTEINAEEQLARPDSVFRYYQKLIALRKTESLLTDGRYEPWMEEDPKIFAYTRSRGEQSLLVVCNFTEDSAEISLPEGFEKAARLIGNYVEAGERGKLRPYEAYILKK